MYHSKQNKSPPNESIPSIKLNPREKQALFAIGNRRTYGLEIHDRIRTCDPWSRITIGTLYPLLKSLEKKGLVTGEQDPTGRKRRYLTITDLGRDFIDATLDVQAQLLGEIWPRDGTSDVGDSDPGDPANSFVSARRRG